MCLGNHPKCLKKKKIIIIFILSLFIQGLVLYFLSTFYFLSSARTAPEPGHSRLIDPGHKPHKGKGKGHVRVIAGRPTLTELN